MTEEEKIFDNIMEKKKEIACKDCSMRKKYDNNPKSLIGRFWHWHIKFCPGWKAYKASLTEEERILLEKKYK
jgi:hypothetical protein